MIREHVEQVVEQPRHVPDLPLDDLVAPADLRLASRRPMRAMCGGLADRRERIAELVREHREELVLAPVGLA